MSLMDGAVAAVADLVSSIAPVDAVEARHRAAALAWLRATDDVFRRAKPATPPRHLVSYVVPTDPADGAVLLCAHRNAGLWLPPGGHVEPGEHPADTARRELAEELAVDGGVAARPGFLTITRTVGIDAGHEDVSLWFRAEVPRATRLRPDEGEFTEVRWWSRAEVAAADPAGFDPHLGRYLAKTISCAPRSRRSGRWRS
jgi:8-oxo-dGTP diphosphatase